MMFTSSPPSRATSAGQLFLLCTIILASSVVVADYIHGADHTDPQQNEFYTECPEGSCVIDLGNINCTVALQKYEFSGNCCSLQPSPTGHCHLIVMTGFCDYADKGYEQCMDHLEDHHHHHHDRDDEEEEVDKSMCGTVHMYVAGPGTEDHACPKSKYTIPDPVHSHMMQQQQQQQQQQSSSSSGSALSSSTTTPETEITIHATLRFQFTPGQGRPPSDKEIAAVLDETDRFFREQVVRTHILSARQQQQQQQKPRTTVIEWFELDNFRSHYDYAADEATLNFSLIFAVPTTTALLLKETREGLVKLVSTSKFQHHIGRHVLVEKMGPANQPDLFQATEGISFQSMLA